MKTHGTGKYGAEWDAYVTIMDQVHLGLAGPDGEGGITLTPSEARRLSDVLLWVADKADQAAKGGE